MKRRAFLLMCTGLLTSFSVSRAFGENKKKNNNKNNKKKNNSKQNQAKQKEAQKKRLKQEIDRVSRKLNLVTQEKNRLTTELSSAEREVESLKSQLAEVSDDSPEKPALSRKVHAAVKDVKDLQRTVGEAESLMARGSAYLNKLEGQYRKLGGAEKKKK